MRQGSDACSAVGYLREPNPTSISHQANIGTLLRLTPIYGRGSTCPLTTVRGDGLDVGHGVVVARDRGRGRPVTPNADYVRLGRLKIEVRRVAEGVLLQVDDRFHVVLTDDAALDLAALLYSTVP